MSEYRNRHAQGGGTHESAVTAGPAPGKRTLVELAHDAPGAVQRREVGQATAPVHEAAARGIATGGDGASGQVQRQGTGEAWPGGPTVTRKSTTHSVAEYVGWIRQVEAKFGAQRANTLQRLRRLYYSSHTGGAGPKFDTVVAGASGAGGFPMTTADLPLAVINALYETNAIVTPNGSLVDVSHILAGLDVHQQGIGLQASVAAVRFDVNFEGVLTWAGDLASWFVESKAAVRKREQETGTCLALPAQVAILLGLVNAKVAKDDLLGDVDAQVMGDQFMTTTYTPPPVSPYGSVGPGTFTTTQDLPLSEMLQRYYGGEPAAAGTGGAATAAGDAGGGGASGGPTSRSRFHYFVAGARPRIPHTVVSQSPLRVALASDASTQIRQYIHNDARMFIDSGLLSSEPQDLTTYAGLLDEVNTRFVRFLTTGLASGDAPWP